MKMETRSIEVPESLFVRIESRIKGSKFASVSEYASFVLRERLASEEASAQSHFTKEEEEKIKDRLRALGYL